jgi:hypothetical protein
MLNPLNNEDTGRGSKAGEYVNGRSHGRTDDTLLWKGRRKNKDHRRVRRFLDA